MRSVIVTHPTFDGVWPFSADHFHHIWQSQGPVEFIRLEDHDNRRLGEIVTNPSEVERLVALHVPVTVECLKPFTHLKEAVIDNRWEQPLSKQCTDFLATSQVKLYRHPSEGFWGQSVSEYGLALTLCGLRRIPQLHHEILTSLAPWEYDPVGKNGRPGARGQQFGDDPAFTNGTIAGKRVRIVGAGNIASRYASFVHMLGADVAAWDPYASDPNFHRSGSRKEWHLDQLVKDAEIFVPMVPLTDSTK